MGPAPRSTRLTLEQEAIAVAFQNILFWPSTTACIPCTHINPLSSALLLSVPWHQSLGRSAGKNQCVTKKKFRSYPIGYFHIDLTEVCTTQGKLQLFVAIDRTSKFAFARLVERADRRAAVSFLQELIQVLPYKIHTILTDNGTHYHSGKLSVSSL